MVGITFSSPRKQQKLYIYIFGVYKSAERLPNWVTFPCYVPQAHLKKPLKKSVEIPLNQFWGSSCMHSLSSSNWSLTPICSRERPSRWERRMDGSEVVVRFPSGKSDPQTWGVDSWPFFRGEVKWPPFGWSVVRVTTGRSWWCVMFFWLVKCVSAEIHAGNKWMPVFDCFFSENSKGIFHTFLNGDFRISHYTHHITCKLGKVLKVMIIVDQTRIGQWKKGLLVV